MGLVDYLQQITYVALPQDEIFLLQQYVAQCLLGVNDSQTFLLSGAQKTICQRMDSSVKMVEVGRVELPCCLGLMELLLHALIGQTGNINIPVTIKRPYFTAPMAVGM